MILFNGNNYEGNLSSEHDGFLWKGNKIFYRDVTSIDYSWTRTQNKINGSDAGLIEEVELQICSKHHPDIDIKNKEVEFFYLFSWRKLKDTGKKLREFHSHLEAETLVHRINWYLNQLDQNGCFVYKTSFMHGATAHGTVTFKLPNLLVFGGVTCDLTNYVLSKSNNMFVLRPSNPALYPVKEKTLFGGETTNQLCNPTIYCKRDMQVVLYVLDKKFSISRAK